MVGQVLLFLLGLAALTIGAEALVRGASRMALSLGISPLVVGLTVVSLGTSAPEMAVSVGAVVRGANDLAVGNVVGSNIFNVLMILGCSALIAPLTVHTQLIRQEVPIMIGASVLLLIVILDGQLSRTDAGILVVLLLVYTSFLVRQSRAQVALERAGAPDETHGQAAEPPQTRDRHIAVQLLLVVAGVGLLVAGSAWLVGSAASFARAFGVSDLIIGLTIVAAGTSLPELATSVLAAVRGERDIAIGNVVGSNIFNIFGCLGVAGLVGADGLSIAHPVLTFDAWVMVAVALACLPVFIAGREIGRAKALLFVGYYCAYVAYLILDAQGHDALPEYSAIMAGFVLPITIVTLITMVLRHSAHRDVVSPP